FKGCGAVAGGRRLAGYHVDVETRLDGVARCLHYAEFASGDAHAGAFARQENRRTLTDGTRAAEHDRALAGQRAAVRQPCDGGRSRGIRAVAIEHDRDAEIAEELGADGGQQRFTLGHVAAADEDGRVPLVLGTASENRAFHESADILGVYSAVGTHMIGAAVVSDDVVEDGRKRVRIKLIKQLFHD